MVKILINPGKYIQGPGELKNLGTRSGALGSRFFVLVSPGGKRRFGDALEKSFEQANRACVLTEYSGICSMADIHELGKAFTAGGCDAVVGVGGGKVIDTAKSIAHFADVPVVVSPTVAASDAPCSALAVLYSGGKQVDRLLPLRSDPALVLVDSEIIAAAPARLFVAGMGDALATYYEARACWKRGGTTCAGGRASQSAMAIARLCHDTLMSDGRRAKRAVEQGACTEAVERVIEANLYMSGTGFESGGVCAAHPINEGLSILAPCETLYHGELVAFGALVQLMLEDTPGRETERFLDFCIDVGLPVTLGQLGITENIGASLTRAAEIAAREGQPTHLLPTEVSVQSIVSAMLSADAEGRKRLSQRKK